MSHKAIAARSGLGWIGKSGLLVTKRYGARIRLGSILTDAPSATGTPLPNGCGECTRCIRSCPAGAISESGYDLEKCLAKLKTFAAIPGIGVHICGVCVKACPRAE
jgi:epoxyqueuosine reductase QueG